MAKKSNSLTLSAAIAVFGIVLVSWKSSNHGICRSGQELPSQQSICTVSETIYYLGIVLIVLGVVLLLVSLVSKSNHQIPNQPSMPVSAPPGWMAHPTKPGWTIWWDGTSTRKNDPRPN